MVFFRLDSVRSLARFLISNSHWAASCGFKGKTPTYRTLSRRLMFLDAPVIYLANQVIRVLTKYHLISFNVVATDSSLTEAFGKPTQKHRPEIKATDSDAKWGWSETRDWVFGYKLHSTSTVLLKRKGKLKTLVPLSWQVTTANFHDSNFYIPLMKRAKELADKTKRKIYLSLADKGYDLNRNYIFAKSNDFRLITPVRRFKKRKIHPLKEESKKFYDSKKGRKIYWRRADSERLFAQLKDLFLIDPLPVVGREKVTSYLSVVNFSYLLGILYNFLNGRSLRAIKSLVA